MRVRRHPLPLPFVLVVLAVLGVLGASGCTSGAAESDHDFLTAHRARLRRQLAAVAPEPRPPARPPRRAPPAPPQQDPQQDPQQRHIDDVLPAVTRRPTHGARLGVGRGRVAIDASGTHLDGDADLRVLRGAIEPMPGERGAGARVELFASDDDLFGGDTISDGITVRPADARAVGFDVFPHHVWQLGNEELARTNGLRVPLRAGAFADLLDLDHEQADVERRWWSLGGRVEIEPSWQVLGERGPGDDVLRLDVFGLLGTDLGIARFTEDHPSGSGSDTTSRWATEAGAGVRLRDGSFAAELGYRIRSTQFGDVDTDLFGTVDRTHVTSDVLYLDFGVRF